MALLRWSILASVALGAASGCTETGAHLTFDAAAGPTSAAGGYSIVLATPEAPVQVTGQRVVPGEMATETVQYYRQRTIANADSAGPVGEVDGFSVRVAPDGTTAETQFVPFVIFYNERGEIAGIGTFGGAAAPKPIFVLSDEIDRYTVTVEAVTEVDADNAPLGPGNARTVRCLRSDGTDSFTSGIAWRPLGSDTELRLVMPGPDGGMDASTRPLDLDCDGHEVSLADNSRLDCDDTRGSFHRDAPDVCDGIDTNCDGAQTIATSCPLSGSTCVTPLQPTNTGVSVCNDETGAETSCHETASCACSPTMGNTNGCHGCVVPYDQAGNFKHPCQPAVGVINLSQCTDGAPCDVEIAGVRGGWKVEISDPTQQAFGSRASGIKGSLAIKAKRPEGPSYTFAGTGGMPLADVDMVLVTNSATIYVPFLLTLAVDGAVSCPSTSPVSMYCY